MYRRQKKSKGITFKKVMTCSEIVLSKQHLHFLCFIIRSPELLMNLVKFRHIWQPKMP